ncbi:hypothetical protein CK203_038719 [Vitis vinifera]|uniref:Uncharacterized protein n=1 Tax=Vitis vinifera TaxID=29760 RepID=A0A438HUT7_VITVI|nr:hypothetical protein CK203_038719 [Vitis vinifera]
MTTRCVRNPNVIHFTLMDAMVFLELDTLQKPCIFHMSLGTSTRSFLLRKELPPRMLLVNVVLRSNIFPLQHMVQRRLAILEALF